MAGNGRGPRKDFRPAVRPHVARKDIRALRETAAHDLGRNAPKIVFRGFARHAEDFSRDAGTYGRTEILTWAVPTFLPFLHCFLEQAGVGWRVFPGILPVFLGAGQVNRGLLLEDFRTIFANQLKAVATAVGTTVLTAF